MSEEITSSELTHKACWIHISGLPAVESMLCFLTPQSTVIDSVDLTHRVQQKLVAEEVTLPDGTELYYADTVHGHLLAIAEAGALAPTQSPDEFTIPLNSRNTSVIVVSLRLSEYGSDSGSESGSTTLSGIERESDDPWNHVTVGDFLRILKSCAALEYPVKELTIQAVMSGSDTDLPLLVALNESLGSSMASYQAIKYRLRKAAASLGPHNPLVSYSMPTQEKYALWSESARMWFRTGSAIRELYLDRPWPGWARLPSLLACF